MDPKKLKALSTAGEPKPETASVDTSRFVESWEGIKVWPPLAPLIGEAVVKVAADDTDPELAGLTVGYEGGDDPPEWVQDDDLWRSILRSFDPADYANDPEWTGDPWMVVAQAYKMAGGGILPAGEPDADQAAIDEANAGEPQPTQEK